MRHFDVLQILWEIDRWDGPVRGFCIVDDEPHYFTLLDERHKLLKDEDVDVSARARVFGIYQLTAEEWKHELKVHAKFRKYVGTHCDWKPRRNDDGKVKPLKLHHIFYDWYKNNKRNIKTYEEKLAGIYTELLIYT